MQIKFLLSIIMSLAFSVSALAKEHSCAVSHQVDNKTKSLGNAKKISKAEFEVKGLDDQEKISVNISGEIYTITVKVHNENSKDLYVHDRLTCDPYLNCNGFRTKFDKQGKSQLTNLTVAPLGAGVQAYFGKRPLFKFKTAHKGFHFTTLRFVSDKQEYEGVDVVCTN